MASTSVAVNPNPPPQPATPPVTATPTAQSTAPATPDNGTTAPAASSSVPSTPAATPADTQSAPSQDGDDGKPDPLLTTQTQLALESAPYQLKRLIDIPNIKVYKEDLPQGASSFSSEGSPIAGVREGDTDKIRVYDGKRYANNPNGKKDVQLPAHEATHLVQNMMDKMDSAKFPENDKADPYKDMRLTKDDLTKLRKGGDTLWKHSREGQASIVQKYVARHMWLQNQATPSQRQDYLSSSGQFDGNGNAEFEQAYGPYLNDLGSVKLPKGTAKGVSMPNTTASSTAVLHAFHVLDGHPDMDGQIPGSPAAQGSIPPPPDGSGIVDNPSAIPPPPDGSGIVDSQPALSADGSNLPPQQGTAGPMSPEAEAASRAAANADQFNTDKHPIAAGLNAVGAGVGEGLLSTANGAADMLHLPHQTLMERQQELKDDNANNPDLRGIGYGGETLMEFLLGDEALKAFPLGKQLDITSKVVKTLEGSPRLMKAVQIGADALKVGARTATVQGAQTLARTGGDVKTAAEQAAIAGVTGGAMDGATGGVADVLGVGKKAADTVSKMGDTAANAPTRAAVEDQVNNAVHGAFNNETGTLQNDLNDATSTVGMFGEGAPQQSAITQAAQKYAKTGEQSVHDAYQAGFDKLAKMAGSHTIPYEESPLQKAAQELVTATPETAGPLDAAFNIKQPASARANAILDRLTDIGQDETEGNQSAILDQYGKPFQAEGEEAVPTDLTMQHLVARRQTLSRILRDLSPTSPDYQADRAVYSKLLGGIDDTIGQLADNLPKEDAEQAGEEGESTPTPGRQLFDQMNQQYREGIRPFQNKDVKNILAGNLNDVSKSIMGGQTSLADIADVKKALGAQNFAQIGQVSLQNIVQSATDDSGELDYKKLFSKFNKINPDVRTAMFGQQGNSLSQALKVANDSSNGMTEIGKQIQDILGNGNIDSILKDPKQAQAIANVVGTDGMKTLGRSILENKISEASTGLDPKTGKIVPSHFDPDKVLDWWMGMKDSPEVRDSFFTVDKDTTKQYNDMMKSLSQASSVKKLVKYGILPLTLGTAGVVHGAGAALMGAVAGLGTEAGFGRARDILDAIANNPRTWKTIGWLGKKATGPTAGLAADALRGGASEGTANTLAPGKNPDKEKMKRIYDAAGSSLGGK